MIVVNENKKAWKDSVIKATSTINDAIRVLEHSLVKICLVVDREHRLIGTITDGDVRRGILKNINLESPVTLVMNVAPLVCGKNLPYSLAKELLKSNKINYLPILNNKKHVIGIHSLTAQGQNDVANTLVIMAGGFGKRLMPITKTTPKPMIDVGGRPILAHIIEKGKLEGFTNIVVSVFYQDEQIKAYFGDGEKFGLHISYIEEPSPLGTAGALSMMSTRPKEDFVVTNGDIISKVPFKQMLDYHKAHQAKGTMAVYPQSWENPFGVVETDGVDIIKIEEKPVHKNNVNAGVYVLSPDALKYIPEKQNFSMPDVFSALRKNHHRTIAYPIHETWLDVGRHEDLKRARSMGGIV